MLLNGSTDSFYVRGLDGTLKNDTIYLCDDIYTGLKARLKTILKSNGIQIQDEDFG